VRILVRFDEHGKELKAIVLDRSLLRTQIEQAIDFGDSCVVLSDRAEHVRHGEVEQRFGTVDALRTSE